MKRHLLIILLLTCTTSMLIAQDLVYPNMPVAILRSNRGAVTIVEYHGGKGFGDVSMPDTKSFNGFNILFGYQVNRSFIIAAGTGVSVYDGGSMVPLFWDIRYSIYPGRLAPFLNADFGMLMKISNYDESVVFMNPCFGVRYSITRQIAANIAAGIFVQSGTTATTGTMTQAAFINFKAGIIYKFWRKTTGYKIKNTR